MVGVNIRLRGKLSSGRCHDGKDIVGREWMAWEVGVEFRERYSLAGLSSGPGGRTRMVELGSVRNRSECVV